MDSLLANYGSDDEEEQSEKSSLSATIPPPKHQDLTSNGPSLRGSLFASLPRPKSASQETINSHFGVAQRRNDISASDATAITAEKRDAGVQIQSKEAGDIVHGVGRVSDKGSNRGGRSTGASLLDGMTGSSATTGSLFSSLPPPRSSGSSVTPFISQKHSGSSSKRVIELRPAIDMTLLQETDDDDNVKPSVKRLASDGLIGSKVTGLAAILPKPKNLGSALGSGYSSGHQNTLDMNTSDTSSALVPETTLGSGDGSDGQVMLNSLCTSRTEEISSLDSIPRALSDSSSISQQYPSATWSSYAHKDGSHGSNFGAWEGYDSAAGLQDQLEAFQQNAAYVDSQIPSYAAQEGAEAQGDLTPEAYTQEMVGHGSTMASSQDALAQFLMREKRKGAKNAPVNIIEVKQSDLTATKLREDQLRTTGIAFGPAYKPMSSNKNKPSKLHRRKHQIGSLYYDMKQKEMELMERRAKGYMTKAETQAKYGW